MMLFGLLAMPVFAQETDIYGYYFIEKPTKDFADISEIHFFAGDGTAENPPAYGLIRLKNKKAKDFVINKRMMDEKNISFTTNSVGGISYQFTGAFTKLGNFPSYPPEGVVLQGTLTKFKGKAKLAAAKVKFTYSPGD
jgi:hypothetical protein